MKAPRNTQSNMAQQACTGELHGVCRLVSFAKPNLRVRSVASVDDAPQATTRRDA